MRSVFAALVTLGALISETGQARAEPSRELGRTGPWALGAETGGVLVLAVGMEVASGGAAPEKCAWCAPGAFDRWGHDALAVRDRKTAAIVSHVPSFVLLPAGALAGVMAPAFAHGDSAHAWQNGWIVVNSFLLTTATASAVKQATARRRPVFYYGRGADSEFGAGSREENLSFFSGDTAWAFNFAATGATLAYLRGYSTAPWIAGVGGALAVTTAVLRVSAESHWPTDVLTGAVVGTSIGVAMPLLLHGRVVRDGQAGWQASGSAGPGVGMVQLGGVF